MKKMKRQFAIVMIAAILLSVLTAMPVMSQVADEDVTNFIPEVDKTPGICKKVFFSTEEEFITQGPEPPDGNPIISDGDLLGPGCVVFARNHKLLEKFDTERDLGLDAADVLDVERFLVAFSTSLDDPNGQFSDGDLLVTNGAVIPNMALLAKFDIQRADLGLDAVQFIGDVDSIIKFLDQAPQVSRDEWLQNLPEMLERYDIDIWFSTEEGFAPEPKAPLFIDGDLLSARTGTIVIANLDLLPPSVPAGIPDRGVDLGLDAVFADRGGNTDMIHFSTEILYEGMPSFTDGDVLLFGNGLVCTNYDLVKCFEPKTKELGLDALSISISAELNPQITHFNQVFVGDISTSGLAYSIEQPFGQWIQVHGYILPDIDEFRVVYCKAADWPCSEPEIDGIEVVAAQNWHVAEADGWGTCDGDRHWYSDADGWFNASEYRALRDCTSDLPLTMWNSMTAPDPDGLYIVWLQYRKDGFEYRESYNHYIQLDNTRPEDLAIAPKNGTICGEFTPDEMPMMVLGHFYDTHFWGYRLELSGGNPWAIKYYTRINHYDNLTDMVGPEGTIGPGMVELHDVDVNDLPAESIDDCAYEVELWTWDRTIRGYSFNAPNDDRPIWFGGWWDKIGYTFDYTP
jgi:hypothetical protein